MVDHKNRPIHALMERRGSIILYATSEYLLKYDPRHRIELKVPDKLTGLDDFYITLKDSGRELMKLHFRLIGRGELETDVTIRRPFVGGRYRADFWGNRYEVTVVNLQNVTAEELGVHVSEAELIVESKGKVVFDEKFYLIKQVRGLQIRSKMFPNDLHQAVLGSMLNYASEYPLKVFVYKCGELRQISEVGKKDPIQLRDEVDKIIEQYMPKRADEYLVFVGSEPTVRVDKREAIVNFEELLDFPEKLFPVYVVGKQAERVNQDSLFINMFVAPSLDYVKDYLRLIARDEFVGSEKRVEVTDLTEVTQGDFQLVITPIITEDFFKELIDSVMEKDKRKALWLLRNFKEFQANKIRKLQAEKLSVILGKKVDFDKPYFYFSKAIFEASRSSLSYYIPSVMLPPHVREVNSVSHLLSVIYNNKLGALTNPPLEYLKRYYDEINSLDVQSVKELSESNELLLRLFNDLLVTTFKDVKRVQEESLKAFELAQAMLKYNPQFFTLDNDLVNVAVPRLYGGDFGKFKTDLVLILRDTFFAKLMGIEDFYVSELLRVPILEAEIKDALSSKEKLLEFLSKNYPQSVLLAVFRQFVMNMWKGVSPQADLPLKFDVYEFPAKQETQGEGGEEVEMFKNVPLPVLLDREWDLEDELILFSFTTPIITLEKGFNRNHHGHEIRVSDNEIRVTHLNREHPDLVITVKYPSVERVLDLIPDKKRFVENFNEIFGTDYVSATSIISEIMRNARRQGIALACANIQPVVTTERVTEIKFKPGSIRLGILTFGEVEDEELEDMASIRGLERIFDI